MSMSFSILKLQNRIHENGYQNVYFNRSKSHMKL